MNGAAHILLTRLGLAVAVLVTVAFPFQARCGCPNDGSHVCVRPAADGPPAQTQMKARHACCESDQAEDDSCCPGTTDGTSVCACGISASPDAVVAAQASGADGASRVHFASNESVSPAVAVESAVLRPSSAPTSHSPPYAAHCALLC